MITTINNCTGSFFCDITFTLLYNFNREISHDFQQLLSVSFPVPFLLIIFALGGIQMSYTQPTGICMRSSCSCGLFILLLQAFHTEFSVPNKVLVAMLPQWRINLCQVVYAYHQSTYQLSLRGLLICSSIIHCFIFSSSNMSLVDSSAFFSKLDNSVLIPLKTLILLADI